CAQGRGVGRQALDPAHSSGGGAAKEGLSMRGAPRAQYPRTACVLGALAIGLALSGGAWADDADLGREAYDDYCVTSHRRDRVDHGATTCAQGRSPKAHWQRFRNAGFDGKPPAMPPWRSKISDDDLKLLWAYVRGGG